MRIQKKPYPIDFIGNDPQYVVRATPCHSEGRQFSRTFAVLALPAGQLIMEVDDSVLTWQLVSLPTDKIREMTATNSTDPAALLDILESKLVYDPELNQKFTVSCRVESSECRVKITAKDPGPHIVTMRHSSSPLFTPARTTVTGTNRIYRNNYRVKARFSVQKNGAWSQATPELRYEESNMLVKIDTSVLKSVFQKPDIPKWNQAGTANHCPNAAIKARLILSEEWSDNEYGEIETKKMISSDPLTLVNGGLEEYAWRNNIPDWETNDLTHFHLKTGCSLFGQNDGETSVVPPESEQYIYIWNYESQPQTVRVIETAVFEDGSTDDDWFDEEMTLLPGLNRITMKETDETVVKWSVDVWHNTSVVAKRKYLVKEPQWGSRTMLLLNSMNQYEPFTVEETAMEKQTEGERRITAGKDKYDTTDTQKVFTARCHPRNEKELLNLEKALGEQNNLLLDGKFAWYLDMVPGSLTTRDNGKDLIETEFQYRLREKVNRDPMTIAATDVITAQSVIRDDGIIK